MKISVAPVKMICEEEGLDRGNCIKQSFPFSNRLFPDLILELKRKAAVYHIIAGGKPETGSLGS